MSRSELRQPNETGKRCWLERLQAGQIFHRFDVDLSAPLPSEPPPPNLTKDWDEPSQPSKVRASDSIAEPPTSPPCSTQSEPGLILDCGAVHQVRLADGRDEE